MSRMPNGVLENGGAARPDSTYSLCELLHSIGNTNSNSIYENLSEGGRSPNPCSSLVRKKKQPMAAPRPNSYCNGLSHALTTQTSFNCIINVLQQKGVRSVGGGHYAIVRLHVPHQHEMSIIIISLAFPSPFYRPVLKDAYGNYFIHGDKRFSTINILLEYYKDNPTKHNVYLSQPITSGDLSRS